MSLEPRKIPETSSRILLVSKDQLGEIISHMSDDGEKKRLEEEARAQAMLREESKKMTDTWVGIPAHLVKEQFQEMKERKKAQEAERKRIDDLEGKFQEMRRKYVLDTAQQRRYEETDQVKQLATAVRLAEALKGNEEAAKLPRFKSLFDKYDAEYARYQLADDDNAVLEKGEDLDLEHEKKKKYGAELIEQKKQLEAKKEKLKHEDFEMRRRLEEMACEESAKTAENELQKMLSYRRMLDEQMTESKRIDAVLSRMDEAEDKRCKIFLDAKRKMVEKHKEMEKERNKVKEIRRKAIGNHLLNLTDQAYEAEEENYLKAVQEKEDLYQKEEEVKKATRDLEVQELVATLKQQMSLRDQIKDKEIAESLDRRFKIDDLCDRLDKLDNTEEVKHRAKQCEHTIMHQMARKLEDRSKLIEGKKQERDALMSSLHDEVETFQKYSNQVVKECQSKGFNMYPIKKAIFTVEKNSAIPSVSQARKASDAYSAVKKKFMPNISETKRRLGFISE